MITVLCISLYGSHIASLFTQQPRYFENDWFPALILYLFSAIGGFCLTKVSKYLKITSKVITSLVLLNIFAYVSLAAPESFARLRYQLPLFLALLLITVSINKFTAKENNQKLWFIIGAIIGISAISTDFINFFKYLNSNAPTQSSIITNRTSKHQIPDNRATEKHPAHTFHLLFDAMSGTEINKPEVLGDTPFYKKIQEGTYFKNSYSNAFRTAISTVHHTRGVVDIRKKLPARFEKILQQKGVEINQYSAWTATSYCINTANKCYTPMWAKNRISNRGDKFKSFL